MTQSLISRLFGAVPQAADTGAGSPWDDRYYPELYRNGPLSVAGYRISPETALRVAAVYRCVSIRANTFSMLPLGIYEDIDRDGTDRGEKRRAPEHPMDAPLRLKPNRRQTSYEFRRQLSVSLLLRQNAFAQMVPVGRGAFELVPLYPDWMRGPDETPGGELRWWYCRPGKEKVPLIEGVDLFHLQGLSEDGLQGLAMIDLAKDTVGSAMAAERHIGRFFERGVNPGGVLQHPGRLKAETANAISDSFSRRYGGEAGAGKVPVLWEGMEFKSISMTLKDAEFLESRKFSVTEIARWFGVPPHLVADVEKSTSWGTGIEEQNLAFLVYSVLPDITLWEQRIRHDLLIKPERFFARVNVNALLRASAKVRYEVYRIAITNGILSPNECRELEDLNPREGGDEYLTPMNMRQGDQPGHGLTTTPEGESVAIALAERLAQELDRPTDREARLALDPPEPLRPPASETEVDRELAELQALAQRSGGDKAKWRRALAGYYGRLAKEKTR